jgi:heme-degrading monooxygenase HmoA
MTFIPEKTHDFLQMFDSIKSKIRNFEGCQRLVLMRDYDHSHIFATYSVWDTADHLEAYRKSELLNDTWRQTKKWFNGKPIAYSFREEMIV